jgi:hypothetical protein
VSTLARLRELIEAEGDPLAAGLLDTARPGARAVLGPIVAGGPRTTGHSEEYELLIEAIYEGYLLHYAQSRLLADGDADLALLAGDRLYALGLERLVALGDVEAVSELADVIALCALLVGVRTPPATRSGARAPARSAGERARTTCGPRLWRSPETPVRMPRCSPSMRPRPWHDGILRAGPVPQERNWQASAGPASPSTQLIGASRAPSKARPSRGGAS